MNNAGKIILYADDDIDDQELLKEAFHQIDAAIDIRIVSGGEECLKMLSSLTDQELPSLIILDYNMPDLIGAEVVERLCSDKRYQSIPKVIWSTSHLTPSLQKSLLKDANYYFQKPDDYRQILVSVRRMLDL